MTHELLLKIERDFDAPIQKVWQAWTDQALIKQWSCPQSFTITSIGGDLRVGGQWQTTMESTQLGYTGKLHGQFKVIVPPHKLVASHIWLQEDGSDGQYSEYTVELSEQLGKTHMVFTQVGFVSPESRDSHQIGWNQSFDKLNDFVEGVN